MSERMFNPSNAKYEKVEDLPKKEQADFANEEEGDGFVRKEAKEEFDDAKKIVELANEFKRAGMTVKDIHGNIKARVPKEIRAVLNNEEITTADVLMNRALEEKLKPLDILQEEASDINSQKYPEKIYLERLRNNPDDLKGIPKNIWDNKKFAIEAVRLNRKALAKIMNRRHNLNGDIEVVLEAIKHDGLALQYAGLSAQADKDIVLEAIKQNPDAIKFASRDIKKAVAKLL